MAFVRYKEVNGKRYYQVVRNYREGDKHRQEVLCHLGIYDSLERAIEHEKRKAAAQINAAAALRKRAKQIYSAAAPAGSRTLSEADIDAIRRDWREDEIKNDSFLDPEYVKLNRWAQRYFPEWEPAMHLPVNLGHYLLVLEVLRRKKDLIEQHRLKLNKLREIQQKYF